jgi:anti-sigma B factor antagonist
MDVLTSHAAFRVESRRVGDCQVIELIGELDVATAPILKAAIDQMSPIPDHIQIDLTELTFIDSTGLRLLLQASRLVGGRIWLKGTSLFVARILDVAGISDYFYFAEDRVGAHGLMAERPAG